MRSIFGSAVVLATAGLFNDVLAIEHPLLASVHDFKETWVEKQKKETMVDELAQMRQTILIDRDMRPVVGVLTEPLRGDLHPDQAALFPRIKELDAAPGYVPRAHVQFLEQAGIRVVPIDYRLSKEEILSLLEKVNGVYLPGDSQLAVTDGTYRQAFVTALAYVEEATFENKEHFPAFLMGNSLSTWVRSKPHERNMLTDMGKFKHSNSRIDLVEHPDDTYFFNKMTREEKQAVFNTAQFFNMQSTGLRPKDLKTSTAFKRHLKPLALYTGHGIDEEKEKFIAIAEGNEIPLYAFTYGIEMVQFFFENPTDTLDNFQLDHSIIARKHAQTVAKLIAGELRMNKHEFDHEDSVFENLIRHEELATIVYDSHVEKDLLPLGMTEHDVYILH